MNRLGPQAKKLFDYSAKSRDENKIKKEATKKYTFMLPSSLMKQVKHLAVEQEKTISQWLAEAIKKNLPKD
jgi:predicted HicB family RNase H-like nuclease